jgi:hypothetical protein
MALKLLLLPGSILILTKEAEIKNRLFGATMTKIKNNSKQQTHRKISRADNKKKNFLIQR